VLSNNDSCIVACSQEVKDLGIKMGTPLFKAIYQIKRNGIQVFSSNYILYGDISSRVMQTLEQFGPHVEVYSRDEAFLDLSRRSDLNDYEQKIMIRPETGPPHYTQHLDNKRNTCYKVHDINETLVTGNKAWHAQLIR
jgi:nucleotidyltransferase/DNA polymerase involved in DNA repair